MGALEIMTPRASNLTFDMSEFYKLVDKIKLRRAELRHHSPSAYVYFHRNFKVEHEQSRCCLCDPVVITQFDWRESSYFAKQILYPTAH